MGNMYNDVSSFNNELEKSGFNSRHIELNIDKFCTDITKQAKDGKLDPVYGRDEEIERVVQIIGRRRKNNPCLVGYAGVGKTAIIEGLAQRIADNKVPKALKNIKIYSLNLSTFVSESKFRGQLEERMNTLVEELKVNKNIILFVDEIHMLCGVGGGDSLSATDILKPALARGEVRCIGATTFDEYKKSIEKDNALARRFQKVTITVPSAEDTIKILNNVKEKYEEFHSVKYSDDIIKKIVSLTENYITDRFFPDKAIDLMDEVGSYKKFRSVKEPKKINSYETKLDKLVNDYNKAVADNDFAHAVKISSEIESIKEKMSFAKSMEIVRDSIYNNDITEDDLYVVISKITGVPLSKINDKEANNLNGIYDYLKSKVIGQDEVIKNIVKCIQRNRIGLKRKTGTIGNFIFLGPSSVGKTYLAKEVGEYLFGKESNILKLDMSEYAEPHSVAKLIGAPPGYVGHEDGGVLTEHVKNNPRTVIIFDEAEKAHRSIYNVLLQIMDEGFAKDSMGRKVDFRNCLVILTSNLGVKAVMEKNSIQRIGFSNSSINNDDVNKEIEKKKIIEKSVSDYFSPEFLNRVDKVVTFNSLTKEIMSSVLDKEISELKENLIEIGNYQLKISKTAKNYILDRGFVENGGVRTLQKTLKDLVEDEICNMILDSKIKKGDMIDISLSKNELSFKVKEC